MGADKWSHPMTLTLEGHTLGKYRLLQALGRGGMAQVYRAYHPQLERYVAVKVLRADLTAQPDFVTRFQREARAAARLRHPNIVQVFDFDAQDDLVYMVMELLEGDSLRARLSNYRGKRQRMPLPEVLRIVTDVLSGLNYAHQAGIIHRDIKPANILLTQNGQAVLTDFGIAQVAGVSSLTSSGALMGTLTYMAPEQGLQGVADARSDLYALGIVLYEMLTGCTPFDADTPLSLLMKHQRDPLPPLHQAAPHTPPALEAMVRKTLAKDPADRYQTAAEMLSALQGLDFAAPSDVVAAQQVVFSGEARQRISDDRFAQDDTDPNVRLPIPGGAPHAPQPAAAMAGRAQPPVGLSAALFGMFALALLLNMAAVIGETIFSVDVFSHGWPFEVLLTAAFFGLLAWSLCNIWLLIPGIIFGGGGLLLAYTSLSGRWSDWRFLWMLLPIIVYAAIALPIGWNKNPARKTAWACRAGLATGLGCAALAALTQALTYLF